MKSLCLGLAVLLGVAAIANGIYMLASPESWYFAVPGVTTTGPFNQHFVRDIGLIFLFLGGAFLVGAARPELRVGFWAAASIWLTGWQLGSARRTPFRAIFPPSRCPRSSAS
jgi:hypothetical protein